MRALPKECTVLKLEPAGSDACRSHISRSVPRDSLPVCPISSNCCTTCGPGSREQVSRVGKRTRSERRSRQRISEEHLRFSKGAMDPRTMSLVQGALSTGKRASQELVFSGLAWPLASRSSLPGSWPQTPCSRPSWIQPLPPPALTLLP